MPSRRLACSFCMPAGDPFLLCSHGSARGRPARQRGEHSQKQCQTMPNNAANKTCSGAPRRAMASKAVEKMKKMAVKAEDMDEDDAFDGDEDYDQAPTSRGKTTPKKFKARVVNGSAPSTPMSKRCVMVVFSLWRAWTHPSRHPSSGCNQRERFLVGVSFFPAKNPRVDLAA